jgi:hypothetical protein
MKVANSRGPETIQVDVLACSGRAVTAAEAATDLEVVTLSILEGCLLEITSDQEGSAEAVFVDT